MSVEARGPESFPIPDHTGSKTGACRVPTQGNRLSFRVPGPSGGWSHILLCDR